MRTFTGMGNQRESPFVLLLRALPPAIVGVMVFQIAIAVGVLMLGAVVAGLLLDMRLGTRPLLTLILGIASLPLSVWLTYRVALRTIAKARASYEAYAQDKRAAADETAGAVQAAPGQAAVAAAPTEGS